MVAQTAAHGGEVLASQSVQSAISFLNSVDAKPKQRSQEDKAMPSTEVGPVAHFSLSAISETSSAVISRHKTLGHSSYFSNDLHQESWRFCCVVDLQQGILFFICIIRL